MSESDSRLMSSGRAEIRIIEGGGIGLALAFAGQAPPQLAYFGPVADVAGGAIGPPPPHQWAPGSPVAPSLFPQNGSGFFGEPALSGFALETRTGPQFKVASLVSRGNAMLIRLEDVEAGLESNLLLAIDPSSGVLSSRYCLKNRSNSHFVLERLAGLCLPLPQWVDEVAIFEGAVAQEGHLVRLPLAKAKISRITRDGRPGHDWTGFFVACEQAASNEQGRTLLFHVDTIGNVAVSAELLGAAGGQVVVGEWLEPGEIVLEPNAQYRSPPCRVCFSGEGLNGSSRRLHRFVRARIAPDWRPVQLNSWEAVYLDVDEAKAMALAEEAARLGAERFVLDDGWFAGRDDDTAGLGDWRPHPRKFPRGLEPLITHVNALKMGFGLWVEPEMVNPNSDLFREHPDWSISRRDGEPPLWRNQLVLDLTRAEVRDHVMGQLRALLNDFNIEYLKWDANRGLFPAGRRAAGQARAVLAMQAQLRREFPGLAIESCASGGGRFSYTQLRSCSRVWISDNTDPIERIRIQQAASLILPPEVCGTHIGKVPNPMTERGTPMAFRCLVSLFGHFGMEFDPSGLPPDDWSVLARTIHFYKEERAFIAGAELHRLDLDCSGAAGDLLLSSDRSRGLLRLLQVHDVKPGRRPPVRLPMLARDGCYALDEIFLDGSVVTHLGTASGAALSLVGLHLLPHFATTGRLFVITRT